MKIYSIEEIQNAYQKAEDAVAKGESFYAAVKDEHTIKVEFLFELEESKENIGKIITDIKNIISSVEEQLGVTELKNYGTFPSTNLSNELARSNIADKQSIFFAGFWKKAGIDEIKHFRHKFIQLLNESRHLKNLIEEKINECTPRLKLLLKMPEEKTSPSTGIKEVVMSMRTALLRHP